MNEKIYDSFVTTAQLAEHLHDPRWVLVDSSFNLADPGWGEENYLKNHIPGAVFAHLDRDLSAQPTPFSGRHPLPDPDQMANRLSDWGVGSDCQVVIYDTVHGAFAARLWWMLQYYGHASAAILEGGYAKWSREDRPLASGVETPPVKQQFIAHPNPTMLLSAQQVDQFRLDPGWKLIDARNAVRYRGEQEPIDPVAGHIPGAVNLFHGENLTPEGILLPTAQLRKQFSALLAGTPIEQTGVYCGSGVTSCLHVAVLKYIGLGTPRLYAGSWSEWIRDPNHAVESVPVS